jgi:hypothetical protein
MSERLMPTNASLLGSDVPVRREVMVVPGGVLTVTVFHFDRHPGSDLHGRRPERPLWQRLGRWLAGHE